MYGVFIKSLICSEEIKLQLSQFKCSNCNIIPFNPFVCKIDKTIQIFICEDCLKNMLISKNPDRSNLFFQNKVSSTKSLYDIIFKDIECFCPGSERGCGKKVLFNDLINHTNNCAFLNKNTESINSVDEPKEDKLNTTAIKSFEGIISFEKLNSKVDSQYQEIKKSFDKKMNKIEKKLDALLENHIILQEEFKFLSKKNSTCSICSERGKRDYCNICDYQFCRKCIIKCKICEKNVCLICIRKNKSCTKNCKNYLCERCIGTSFIENNEIVNPKALEYFYHSSICGKNKCLQCDVKMTCRNCSKSCCSDCFKDGSLTVKDLCNKCFLSVQGDFGKIFQKYFPSQDKVDSNNFSKTILIGTNNGKMKHFSLEKFTIINQYFFHKDAIKSLRQKEDKFLTCSSDSYLKVWDINNFDKPIYEYCDRQDKSMYNEIADSIWMKDNLIISACINNDYCLLFDVLNKKIENKLTISNPTTLCKLSDNSVLIGTEISKIINWDIKTNQINYELIAHKGTNVNSIIKLKYYGKESFLSSGDDYTLMLWDIHTKKNIFNINNINCNSSIYEINDGRIVNGCNDFTIKLWDLNSKSCSVLKGHKDIICDFLSINDYYILSCSFDHSLRMWDLRKNESVKFYNCNYPLVKIMELTK